MESEIPAHIAYIFIDESGDLGPQGSEYFTIVALTTDDELEIRRIMKQLRKRKLKKKIREMPEIKANSSNETIRRYVLGMIASSGCSISAVAIPKSRIREDLFEHKEKLYNYLCGLLFEHITLNVDLVDVTIDKKHSNRLLREDFNRYVSSRIKARTPGISVRIRHLESQASNELQAVDFIAWAVNRKFSWDDSSYYDLIRSKILNAGHEEIWGK